MQNYNVAFAKGKVAYFFEAPRAYPVGNVVLPPLVGEVRQPASLSRITTTADTQSWLGNTAHMSSLYNPSTRHFAG